MCRWCEWVAAAALHAVTTRSIGAGCLSTGGKRLSSACIRRESEVHAGYALVALPCSTSTTRTCVSMSAGPLPKFCLREVLVNGEDTDTTPSHAYAYLPTSVPHHTSDYLPGTLQVPPTLHLTTPHHFHTTINNLPPPPTPPPPPPSPPSSTRLPTGASRLRHDSRVN